MKVLIATGLYPPETGGPATDAACMKKMLPTMGISVEVYPFSRVRRFPPGIRHVMYCSALFIQALRADVIIAMDTVSVGLPVACAAACARKPLIVRVPGDYAWEQGRQRFDVTDSLDDFQGKTYGWQVEVLRRVQRFVVRSARSVLVPSKYFEGVVSHWGIAAARIHCAYLGVDLPSIIEAPKHIPSGRIMVSAGRLVPWKGFRLLIDILPSLPGWHLVIVGDGPLRAALEEQAKKLGLQERVLFARGLPRSQVLGWCKVANAFVLNTSFESFSFQIVEAMMMGVPVITTRIGSIPELIENGKEGVLLAPDAKEEFKEAIVSTVVDREVWSKRVQRAQEKAGKFSVDTAMNNLATEIRNLCA